MHNTRLTLFLSFLIFLTLSWTPTLAEEVVADTTITVDKVQITAIKQGLVLRSEPVAATIVGSRMIRRGGIHALKNLTSKIPNLHIPDYGSRMTSSIYVRGLGARIDQPVMGLTVDNVPMMNKNTFDAELADAERIEVLRGPQSTLYGRNTMGGVMNVYTLSPMSYQGTRIMTEYASGNSFRARVSTYQKLSDKFAFSVGGFYNHTDGLFENEFTHSKCDWEHQGGGRVKLQWRPKSDWMVDNTLSFSHLNQGGYPYAYVGEDKVDDTGETILRNGQISYNDPSGYRRTTLTDGLTVRHDAEKYSLLAITSYLYMDDGMTLDNDFTPLDYFTMRQLQTEHSISEEVVIRSRNTKKYGWLFGAMGFYRHLNLNAPVFFQHTGIQRLIMDNANRNGMGIHFAWDEGVAPEWELPLYSDFRNPSFGGAIYHESRYKTGGWVFTAGLRIDTEHTSLDYKSRASLPYLVTFNGRTLPNIAEVDDANRLEHTYTEVLPKFTAMYQFDEQRNLYVNIARGYKAGGFNTQIFSDILQQKLMNKMASGMDFEETDVMSYRPEYSWNYELGGHFMCLDGVFRGDVALFYIDVEDQQLTVFPEGQGTGRMMTNAGKSRSWGAEFTLQITPNDQFNLNFAYGYTNAKFKDFDNGEENFRGNFVPYAPRHTLSLVSTYALPTGVNWLGDVVFRMSMRGNGRIYWNEQNTLSQPLYTLWGASIGVEHKNYSLTLWSENMFNKQHDVFYFKSMGNEFVQRGRPRTFGFTLNINIH